MSAKTSLTEKDVIDLAISSMHYPHRSKLKARYDKGVKGWRAVYLAYGHNRSLWKIGMSKNPQRRLPGINTEQSEKFEILAFKYFPFGRLIEIGLHQKYKPKSAFGRGELFYLSYFDVVDIGSFLGEDLSPCLRHPI